MRTLQLKTLFAAGLLCFAASAQNPPAKSKKSTAAAGPAMPKPAAEMKDLRAMIGIWSTDEKFEPGPMMPPGGTGAGTATVRLGPGGFTVIVDQRSKNAMGSFAGHGVYTWDPNEKAYKFYWGDSMGPGVVMETGHKDGDNLVFTGEVTMEGKKIRVRDVFSDRMPTSFTLTSYMNDGSGEKQDMSIKFTKQEPPAKK